LTWFIVAGLEILGRLLTNVQKMEDRATAQDFYRSFFVDLLEHVLSVVTDNSQVQVAGESALMNTIRLFGFLIFSLALVLSSLTAFDMFHFSGLSYYAEILCQMFTAVESPAIISAPLNAENPQQSNIDFIYEFVGRLFKSAFPHLSEYDISSFLYFGPYK
jgi:hypothetical protein